MQQILIRRSLQSLSFRWKSTTSSKKEEVIPRFIGDVGRGLVQSMEALDLRMQPEWSQEPRYLDEEDTPHYFADRHPKDLIFRADVLNSGKMRWPLIPEVDARRLSNSEWLQPARQRQNLKYCEKHGLLEVFPKLQFQVNLNIHFGDMYWDSVFFGNYLPASKVQSQPSVCISADATADLPEDSLFTLMMFSPDYPFRTDPEQGHLLHWMICNVPMGQKDSYDTVVDYMPPLPTEYAGHFRYIFALFRQDNGPIQLPAPSSETHYALEHRRNFFLHANRVGTGPEDQNITHVQQHLPSLPATVTFFHCCYDIEVTEYYQKHGLQEPIYTPENMLNKLLMAEKYKEREAFQMYHKMPQWQKIWPQC